jgi:hypothetical protein
VTDSGFRYHPQFVFVLSDSTRKSTACNNPAYTVKTKDKNTLYELTHPGFISAGLVKLSFFLHYGIEVKTSDSLMVIAKLR